MADEVTLLRSITRKTKKSLKPKSLTDMELQESNADSSIETTDKKDTKLKGILKNWKRKLDSMEDNGNDEEAILNGEISSKKRKKNKSGKEPAEKGKKPFVNLQLTSHFKKNKKLGEHLTLRDIQRLILFCTLKQCASEQLGWCVISRRKKIKKVVVILLRSVGQNDFGQHIGCFPFITNKLSSSVVPIKASGTDFSFQHPHETLLSVPLSKSQMKKKWTELKEETKSDGMPEKIHEDGSISNKECDLTKEDKEAPVLPSDKSIFLLSKTQLESNKYPIRCYDENADDEDGFLPCVTHNLPTEGDSDEHPVFAIDCEMCVTSEGYELTRISIIDESMNVLYDTLVKPDRPILDYKTQYSGITEECLKGVTVTLQDVQKQVAAILPPGAILVGHSFECDLTALKMYHDKVIDTAVSFQAKKGGPFKPSLKYLANYFLQKKIQKGTDGHCSIEDAKTCMELVKLKFKHGPGFGMAGRDSEGLFKKMGRETKTCSMLDYPYTVNLYKTGGHHVVPCTSDSEIVLKAAQHIKTSDFIWIHLQAVQHFYERLQSNAMDEDKKEEMLKELDSRVQEIYQEIPENCLTLVIMGCGDVRDILRLQKDPEPRREELRQAVQEAKKGLCFIKFT